MRLPNPFKRKKTEHPPLRKRGEDTPPDPDGKISLWRGGGDGTSSGNGDNRSAGSSYGMGSSGM